MFQTTERLKKLPRTRNDAANRLTKVGDVVYTWDVRGNLTGDGAFTCTCDAARRMEQAQSLTATLVDTDNADGLRVAQSVNGAATAFTWDWTAGVLELLSDGESAYLIGYDTLGWQTGSDWRFVLPDALGSVRQELDAIAKAAKAAGQELREHQDTSPAKDTPSQS